jgi:lipopolysaccharide export LptBFGC system permease protein LptF
VTAVFCAAILFGIINLILTLFVIPESLDKAKRRVELKVDPPIPAMQNEPSFWKRLFAPLAVFAPQRRIVNGRIQEDWSMLWVAAAVFLLFLAGVRSGILASAIEGVN